MHKKKRKNTRNKVWPETVAHVKYRDQLNSNNIVNFKAGVDNLGSDGVFIKTEEAIVSGTDVEIKIDFNPGSHPPIIIFTEGIVLRTEKNGFAVRFTKIDVHALGECIMEKLNLMK